MKLHRFGVGLAVVVAVAAVSPTARAQDRKAVKKIEDANAKAMEEYDLLEFESAKKLLNGALVEIKRAGLDQHPIAARTHGNLGIVYEGLGDPDNALLEFISALEIDAKWTLPKEYKKPELQKIFDSARSTVGKGGGRPAPGGDDAPAPGDDDDVSGFRHQLVEEAKEGQPIKMTARVGGEVGASKVVVYYRAQGQEEFTSAPLRKRGSTWEGAIPASATRTESIQYYVEVQDGAGKALDNSGNRGSPNIIEIARTSGSVSSADLDDENPLGGGGGGGSGEDENGVSKAAGGKSKYSVYVNVSVGSGAGFVSGDTEQSGEPVKAGIAPAPLHVMPELGFWLSPTVTLSIYGRIGMPLGANIPGHAPAAPAGLLRVTYHSSGADGLAFHGDIGGGFIRHTVSLKVPFAPVEGEGSGDVDTVASGPLLVGGGVSWSTTLAGPLRFLVDANLLAGIPVVAELGGVEPQFAVNGDLSLGFQIAF